MINDSSARNRSKLSLKCDDSCQETLSVRWLSDTKFLSLLFSSRQQTVIKHPGGSPFKGRLPEMFPPVMFALSSFRVPSRKREVSGLYNK